MAKDTNTSSVPKISFWASLPDILSAVSLSGLRDSGARIKLDIPASDVGAIVLLQQKGAGHLLKVTVEIVDNKLHPTADNEADKIATDIANGLAS